MLWARIPGDDKCLPNMLLMGGSEGVISAVGGNACPCEEALTAKAPNLIHYAKQRRTGSAGPSLSLECRKGVWFLYGRMVSVSGRCR